MEADPAGRTRVNPESVNLLNLGAALPARMSNETNVSPTPNRRGRGPPRPAGKRMNTETGSNRFRDSQMQE